MIRNARETAGDVSVDFCLTKLDNRIVFVPVSILITTLKWFAHFLALHLCSGTLIQTCSQHPFSILRCERQSFNFRHFLHRCSDVSAASRFTASSIRIEDSMVCTRFSSSHASRKFINMGMCRLLVATCTERIDENVRKKKLSTASEKEW